MPRRAPNPNGNAIVAPFQGLYLDRPPHIIPPTGLQNCNNVRVYNNQITNKFMGWAQIAGPLNGPVCGGFIFTTFNGIKFLIAATPTDVYVCNPPATPYRLNAPKFITPIYATGTASASGTAVTGAGTAWNTVIGGSWRKNARPGDQINFGSATQNDPTATWFTVASVSSDTSLTLTTSAGSIAAGAYTIRQCLANTTTDNRMRFEEFIQAGSPDNGDIVMGVNGSGALTGFGTNVNAQFQDPIFKWNPANTFGVYMSGLNFNGFRIKRFQNVMVVGSLAGPTLSPQYQNYFIASSDNGLPSSFSTGIAFTGAVGDTPFYIAHLGVLGNSILIYGGGRDTRGTVVSAQFVGFPTIWQFSTTIQGRGTFNPDTVIEFPDRHEFFHYDGQYRYNGLFVQVVNDHIWRNLVINMAISRVSNIVCIPAISYGDIIWAIPLTNDASGNNAGTGPAFNPPFTAFVEHYMEQPSNYLFKPYTKRDAPFTCYMGQGANNVWAATPGPVVGDASGNIHLLYASDTQNGTPFTSTAHFADRIIAGERSRGLVKRVYPHFNVILPPPVPPVGTALAGTLMAGTYAITNGNNAVDGGFGYYNVTPFVQLFPVNGGTGQQWTWNGSTFSNVAVAGGGSLGATNPFMADNNDTTVTENAGDNWTVAPVAGGWTVRDNRTSNYLAIVSSALAMSPSVQTVWTIGPGQLIDFNLSVILRLKDRIGGPVTITDTQTIDALAPVNRFTTHYRRGRLGSVAISSNGGTAGTPWTLYGYDWDLPTGSPGGQR